MINLIQGSATNVVVTALEKQTIAVAFYLFEFSHTFSNTVVTCTGPDISIATQRYDEFLITCGPGSATAGFADLLQGQHTYRILQCTTFGLTPDTPEVVLEEGFVWVTDPNAPVVVDYTTVEAVVPAWAG